jgi:hypothetical protein
MSSMARVISEGSQINDFFEDEKDNIEYQKTKMASKKVLDKEVF